MGHRRRSNGEGTLFKRKDGRWSAQAAVVLPNGTTKRICITNRNRDTVKAKLQEALNQKHNNISYAEKDWTVGEYLDYWMREVQSGRISDNTWSMYSRAIKNHLKPTLGGHKLKNLSVSDVRVALDTIGKRGYDGNWRSGAMSQKSYQILSACLNCAMREELIFRNVAQLVGKPKCTPKETMIWSKAQAMHFLQSTKDHPQYIAFLLLITYGMRRGEVLGLRYSDIDFDNGLIYVRQQIDRIDGIVKARQLKTKNSRRTLPLMSVTRQALIDHAEKRGVIMPPFNPCHEFSMEGTIVTSGGGKPLESSHLAPLFHRLTEKAGLPRIKLHATRHTTATILKDLNIPIKDVQLILGHANIATTLNIYQHGTPEAHREAISGIENHLFGLQLAKQHTDSPQRIESRFVKIYG